MKIKNCMEDFVFQHLDDFLEQNQNVCKCEQCKTDIAVLALNSLKPCYVTTEKGDLYTRLELYETENEVDIFIALGKAIDIVEANPRHVKR